ncbi:DUF2273 domain-containing protein [Streptococcus ruminantium]|uniref:DUF2273 domain-containing protein n=1 Tax=Streptococcus ruminantium TaxID=1917441 RepID=A0ABU1B1Z2_9STRE|nr:DUF2273 domain-containing protein [Streptococcus ruminantium]MDQ8758543.1 DUF2273 domain-containing protein [Streptococcus ruminantium]MDQ8765071.1 DUF2273 domain-containing protein [Streptococcus ruminantium]MDQ8768097.1 DUF2273 domain-containing protein [Streptococcus ruminantium]MDQ8774006.1 DUF2273 domain-containing protein [Streptococcus ruminantium]MDQ8794247.1 DUF2273 domain-containing protein [Streptococcus ruminantium]
MNWKKWFSHYQYSITGALVGLLVAVLLIQIGFLKTLLIVAFMLSGIFIANYLQKAQLLKQLFK